MDLEGKYIANRYEILERVGNGGMATVYKAKDTILNRNVAVKVLKEEFTTDEEFIRRFNVEAQSAAALAHQNIVSIYDVGNEHNIYYIVMELIQGKTLKQIISKDGRLPWKWSVNIAIQIAQALEVAHKNNIVHRDIKPHNIIITEDGVAKVTDFGIAKAVSNSTITAFGSTIGSVHYFSPEHARGGYTDAKSDIYSLGVVMYEMLTGRVPFDADTPVSIALKHMQEKPIEPRKLNEKIPPAVNKIIIKAMEKEPTLRYQTAEEMLKDLKLALKDPEGNLSPEDLKAATQRINTVDARQAKKQTNKKVKRELKFITYLKNNPKKRRIILIIVSLILIPILLWGSMTLTRKIIDKNSIKDINVPNFIGMTVDEVKEILLDSKLTYEVKAEEYNSEYEAGKIIWQSPSYAENYKIKENSVIEVKISKGKETAIVPKVAGMTYEEATKALNNSKLVIERVEEKSTKIEEGIVIRQEPVEGTELIVGETVKAFISIGNGLQKISVPYVIGKTEADATKELKESKLKVEITYEENKTKPEGEVLAQSSEVGSVLEEGATIVLTVNKIQQVKSGTVNVNLKSLTGFIGGLDADGNEIVPKKIKLRVTVNDDEVHNKEYSEDTENVSVQVQGIGTVYVKVYIGTTLKAQTQLSLNSENPVWTAK